MARAKRPRSRSSENAIRYHDDEERELIESFEAALDRGEAPMNTPEELAKARAEWKAIALASLAREAVAVSLEPRDLKRIEAIARQRGVSPENLMRSVLHDFAESQTVEPL